MNVKGTICYEHQRDGLIIINVIRIRFEEIMVIQSRNRFKISIYILRTLTTKSTSRTSEKNHQSKLIDNFKPSRL